MTLLREIQDAAVDSSIPVSELLRKCKVLAHRLKHTPLKEWVEKELDGYGPEDEIPDYRVIQVRAVGNFVGPFGAQIKMAPIPAGVLPERFRDWARRTYLRQSIAHFEGLLEGEADQTLSSHWPTELVAIISDKVYEGYACLGAWQQIPRSVIFGLVDGVRNRVLNFALEIEEENPEAGSVATEAARPPVPEERLQQIFNTTIMGSPGAVAVGSADVSQSVTQQVIEGDLESLKRYFESVGIAENDLANLQGAVRADPAPRGAKSFGPRVSEWIGTMVGKAAAGAWDVATSSASALLTEALLRYYGMK